MPVSEAPNDARDLVRVRFSTGLTDNVAGVNLVRGEAQNGCTPAVAERLRAIFGNVVEIVGPWAPAAPAEAVVEAPPEEEPADSDDPTAPPSPDDPAAPPPAPSGTAEADTDPGPRAPTARKPRTPRRRAAP